MTATDIRAWQMDDALSAMGFSTSRTAASLSAPRKHLRASTSKSSYLRNKIAKKLDESRIAQYAPTDLVLGPIGILCSRYEHNHDNYNSMSAAPQFTEAGGSIAPSNISVQHADEGLENAAGESGGGFDKNSDATRVRVQERYAAEREKRIREDGLEYGSKPRPLSDGDSCEILIIGAGFGGVVAAVRLLEAGIRLDELCIVDSAGGFGGTWYWNRYPGLTCDVESYTYFPLLEEMGYMPRYRYPPGGEIRDYINLIADKHRLRERAIFENNVNGLKWNDEQRVWKADLQAGSASWSISAKFVLRTNGLLSTPKIPKEIDTEVFEGEIFHTSRWNYDITGGSQKDPKLDRLKDKNVAIIGTGATSVQCVPELANYAKKLYVFQRTPTGVDWRGQKETDPDHYVHEIANKKGWQRDRISNFQSWLCNWPDVPKTNLVADAWTEIRSCKTLVGGTNPFSMPNEIPDYIKWVYELDFERQERVRKRVDNSVTRPEVAEKLKPWYASFCKRPTFSDVFLRSFNQDNVELVDTDGKGVDGATKSGLVAAGKEYQVDVLVLSTGYLVSADSVLLGIPVVGSRGKTVQDKMAEGWGSLHGRIVRGFPNFHWFVPVQAGTSVAYTFCLDQFAIHSAYLITAARERARQAGGEALRRLTVEPTAEAEGKWALECMMRAGSLAAMSGCTPGYQNAEGSTKRLPAEQQAAAARMSPWGEGMESYTNHVERWRAEGKLSGLELSW